MKLAFLVPAVLTALLLVPSFVRGGDGHRVALRPGTPGSKLAPRYSPKGYRVPLAPKGEGRPEGLEGFDHQVGRLLLGPKDTRGAGHLLVLARSMESKAFDRLWIDRNGDGTLAVDEMMRTESRVSRGNVYTSYTCEVRVNHGSLEVPVWQPYPISLWVAVPSEEITPAFIRFSRRGFLVGAVSLGDAIYKVVLSDANNDAVFGEGDWWALLPAEGEGLNNIGDSRKVGDFSWAGGKAFKLKLEGTSGCRGTLMPFDPGLTPEADARERDPYWDDRHAERAEAPVPFQHDAERAIKAARAGQSYYFLDFETPWCGPCKQMDRWVYTSKGVVAAAKGIVCIKVDGDERKDLKERHKVAGFPTGILFRPTGEEVARFSGYRSGALMVAFFKKAAAK